MTEEISTDQWWTTSWNPMHGCTPASEGCRNCWARAYAESRLRGRGEYSSIAPFAVTCVESKVEEPLHWREPRTIAVCLMGDLFHAKVPSAFILDVFSVMEKCTQHRFIVLTKRADRMAAILNHDYYSRRRPRNVIIGTSVESQATALSRLEDLSSIYWPGGHLVSLEPLLGPVDVRPWIRCPECHGGGLRGSTACPRCFGTGRLVRPTWWMPGTAAPRGFLDWVIIGAETGRNARPMDTTWALDVVEACRAGVGTHGRAVPVWFKKASGGGKLLDGRLLRGQPWTVEVSR